MGWGRGAPGADGEVSGGGNSGVRGNIAVGGVGAIVVERGSTVRVLRPLRTALHTISISLQNSLS